MICVAHDLHHDQFVFIGLDGFKHLSGNSRLKLVLDLL